MIPFTPSGTELVAQFETAEVAIIDTLVVSLCELASPNSSAPNPFLTRLLPDAYTDDVAASEEFRRFTSARLIETKIGHASTVRETTARERDVSAGTHDVRLSASEAEAWLCTLTDLRLILAPQLGIVNDGDRSDDDSFEQSVYDWLATVQESLVQSLNSFE